ncbi:MAG: hypothetical protein J6K32_09405 [Clostridia bacterium]|nr:hypothetical protein [Clostridia bacterium]
MQENVAVGVAPQLNSRGSSPHAAAAAIRALLHIRFSPDQPDRYLLCIGCPVKRHCIWNLKSSNRRSIALANQAACSMDKQESEAYTKRCQQQSIPRLALHAAAPPFVMGANTHIQYIPQLYS